MSLQARGLAFGFRDRRVGEAVDLTVREGEITCVLGPNGSGKTTLLRTLLGLLPRTGGTLTLDGGDLEALADRERSRHLAYVPQASESHFDFSVREMVEMGRTAHQGLFSAPSARDRAVAAQALERLGIAHLSERAIQRLSGGERQLALIARALATEARILMMDEPTANLDFANQARVLDELARLREDGAAIVFTTHHPDHALRTADQALLLRAGRVLASGPTASAVNSENLSVLYAQRVEVLEITSDLGQPVHVCVARATRGFD